MWYLRKVESKVIYHKKEYVEKHIPLLLITGLEALSHFINCVEMRFPKSPMCNTYIIQDFLVNSSRKIENFSAP